MKNYETVFILTPVLSDEQMKDTVQKFIKVLKDGKANIINEEQWGLRKLAYPIQHKSTGFYNLVEFEADPELVSKLVRKIDNWYSVKQRKVLTSFD